MPRSNQEQQQALHSTWLSVWVNISLATLQVAIGWFARSQALMADGLHSLSDLVADIVVLAAARHSQDDADDDHPYGHARYETAASLAIGVILLATGMGMIWGAGLRLHDGASLGPVHPVALGVAVLTLVAKEGLFRYMRAVGERLKSSMLIANAWHARADAASSLVVAAGIAANLMGWHSMDVVAAVIVGAMITRAGWSFSVDAFHSLTDHALDPDEIDRIHATVMGVQGVAEAHNLRTRRMGDWAVVDMHVEVDPYLTVSEGHYIAEQIVAQVKAAHRVAECTVHVDPGHVRHVEQRLLQPPRPVVMERVRAVLGEAPFTLRLHYLEKGLEIDVGLGSGHRADEVRALRQQIERAVASLPGVGAVHLVADGGGP